MTKVRLILAVAIFLISGICFADHRQKLAIAPDGSVYYNSLLKEHRKRVLKYSPSLKKLDIYYCITYKECNIDDVYMDAQGKKMAIIGACPIQGVKEPDKDVQWQYYLEIVDSSARKEIVLFKNAFENSFSPDGKSIAFAEKYPGETGSPIPPGYQGGLWVYDFKSKAKTRIDTLGVNPEGDYRPQDLNWSEHDGNIYYTNYDKVFRYDPRTGKGTITSHKGIYFSPDGKYYAIAAWEGGGGICRTSDDREMIEWEKLILVNSPEQYQDMAFMFWSKKLNAGVFSVTVRDQKTKDNYFTNVIFDVGQGRVLGDFQGYIMGINAQGSLVAISAPGTNEQGKIKLINLTKFKK